NRIVRANLDALDAYPFKRAGLSGHALDTGVDYLHNGSGWQQAGVTGWVPVAPNGSWSVQSGYPLRVRRSGNRVDIQGAVTGGGTVSNVLTIPDGFRPATNAFLPRTHSNSAFNGSPLA